MANPYASVLIVGGKGMLASAVARALTARQHAFAAVDLPEYDITREADVRRMFAEFRPSLVLNCAAHTKVDLCEDEEDKANAINGHAVGLLATAAKEHHSRLVHIGTDFVFDGTGRRPYRPEDPPNPLSAYGRSKLLGEVQIRQLDPPGCLIARTAWLYGRRGFSFPRTMVEKARAGQPLRVVNDQIGSPTYTEDLAEALLDLVEHEAHGIVHVTNAGSTNWYDFAAATLEEFGLKTDLAPITTPEYLKMRPKQAIRPMYSVLDAEAFAKAVGRGMRPWREALHDYRLAVERAGGF